MLKEGNISLFYHTGANFGDALNTLLIEKISGKHVVWADSLRAEYVCIGSLLESFIHTSGQVKYLVKKFGFPRLRVWGTGFIAAKNEIFSFGEGKELFFRRMEILALRGELSKKRLESALDKDLSYVPLGDPALLSPLLVSNRPLKKYKYGIIPHYADRDESMVSQLMDLLPSVRLIDVTVKPLEVINQILECENILSSAMHGLIVADAFIIPNVRLIVSDKIKGGDYKFNDYYSIYKDNDHNRIDLRSHHPIQTTVKSEIISKLSSYRSKADEIKIVKQNLLRGYE